MKILTKRFNLIRIILLILSIGSTLTFFIGDVASTRPPSSGAGGVLATILVGDRPDGIAYNPSNQMVYVTVLGSAYNSPGKVAVIDGRSNKVVTNLLVDSNPEAVLYEFEGVFEFLWDESANRKSTRLNSSHTVISYAVF